MDGDSCCVTPGPKMLTMKLSAVFLIVFTLLLGGFAA